MGKTALFLILALALPPARGWTQDEAAPGPEEENRTMTQPADPPEEPAVPAPPEAPPDDAPAVEVPAPPSLDEGSGDQERAPEPPPSADMSLDDIRFNFQSVIEGFVSARSPDGYWPLKEKSTKKIIRLKLAGIDLAKLRKEEDARGVFTAPAVLLEVGSGRRIPAEFTADLSGEQWKVTRMRLLKGPAPKPDAGDEEDAEESAPQEVPAKPAKK